MRALEKTLCWAPFKEAILWYIFLMFIRRFRFCFQLFILILYSNYNLLYFLFGVKRTLFILFFSFCIVVDFRTLIKKIIRWRWIRHWFKGIIILVRLDLIRVSFKVLFFYQLRTHHTFLLLIFFFNTKVIIELESFKTLIKTTFYWRKFQTWNFDLILRWHISLFQRVRRLRIIILWPKILVFGAFYNLYINNRLNNTVLTIAFIKFTFLIFTFFLVVSFFDPSIVLI